MFSDVHKRARKAGKPPGSATYTGDQRDKAPIVTVISYSKEECEEKVTSSFDECLLTLKPGNLTWINVERLYDVELIQQIGKLFKLHPLTIEDILNVEQRPKIEEFEDYIFITLVVLLWDEKHSAYTSQQLSLVLGENFVLSFHELDTNLFDNIRQRLKNTSNQALRKQNSDYLMYRLIDSVVDQYFVVLEGLGEQIEKVEDSIIASSSTATTRAIYHLKRQTLFLRKAVWPARELLNHLLHAEGVLISASTRIYIRDVYDHVVQAMDTIETFRDMLGSMLDIYLSSITNRMNEVMKTLTIIATIFIPITALSSIYGMNFHYMPELAWHYGYPAVLCVMLMIAVVMLVYFRKKKWI